MRGIAARLFACLFVLAAPARAIDNGYGTTPPMGWRSWNQFQAAINQDVIETQCTALTDRSRAVVGRSKPTSLADLGFRACGIDDGWQKCNSGPGGNGFHAADGSPIIDTSLFPDMKAMTAKIRALDPPIRPGWYGNNCKCRDTSSALSHFEGDVRAAVQLGFQGLKLDGCGGERNVTLFSALINKTGTPLQIENCHNGPNVPAKGFCPFNFFRSSTDIRPTYGSVVSNLQSVLPWVNLTGPGRAGCGVTWAYPDMLEVGVTNSQRPGMATLSQTEAQSHFGAWCIVSAPLTIGMDLTDSKTLDKVWPILTNTEAIAVNQAWAGHPGTLLSQDSRLVNFTNCDWSNNGCSHPSWQVWYKPVPQPQGAVAVLLMNHDSAPQDVSVLLSSPELGLARSCGGMGPSPGCNVRDLWARQDMGRVKRVFTAQDVPAHGSSFVIIAP